MDVKNKGSKHLFTSDFCLLSPISSNAIIKAYNDSFLQIDEAAIHTIIKSIRRQVESNKLENSKKKLSNYKNEVLVQKKPLLTDLANKLYPFGAHLIDLKKFNEGQFNNRISFFETHYGSYSYFKTKFPHITHVLNESSLIADESGESISYAIPSFGFLPKSYFSKYGRSLSSYYKKNFKPKGSKFSSSSANKGWDF